MSITKQGQEILSAMQKRYGEEKGHGIFYTSIASGRVAGVGEKCAGYDRLYRRACCVAPSLGVDIMEELKLATVLYHAQTGVNPWAAMLSHKQASDVTSDILEVTAFLSHLNTKVATEQQPSMLRQMGRWFGDKLFGLASRFPGVSGRLLDWAARSYMARKSQKYRDNPSQAWTDFSDTVTPESSRTHRAVHTVGKSRFTPRWLRDWTVSSAARHRLSVERAGETLPDRLQYYQKNLPQEYRGGRIESLINTAIDHHSPKTGSFTPESLALKLLVSKVTSPKPLDAHEVEGEAPEGSVPPRILRVEVEGLNEGAEAMLDEHKELIDRLAEALANAPR